METPPNSPPPPSGAPAPEAGQRPRASLGNVVGLLGLVLVLIVTSLVLFTQPRAVLRLAGLAVVVLIPVLVPVALGHWGRKHCWPPKSVRHGSIVFVALWLIGLAGVIGQGIPQAGESSKLKAMMPRQMSAALDQYYLENDFRIFAAYRDLVGPQQYIKSYNPVDGEDLGIQFPIRRDWSNSLPVRLPDGTTVPRYEVIAAVGRSGLIATYPLPQVYVQFSDYRPDRVFRLDCGISYRGNHVVDLPPDPAGREGRDQDGVHVYQLADGSRFEITYRGGVPDGPFRAFFPDGRPWGEATYEKGRLVGPSWLILRDGRKIDELADGDAAQAAMTSDEAAAKRAAQPIAPQAKPAVPRPAAPAKATPAPTPEQTQLVAALRKAATRDFAGAEAEITTLIDGGAPKFAYFLHRARFRFFQGNLDGAIADYDRAEPLAPSQSQTALERAHVLRAKHDLAGAAREYRAVLEKEGKRFHPTSGRVALWLYATECARGPSDAARQELEEHMQRLAAFKKSDIQQASANLDAQLAGLLLGRTSEAQAEAAVNESPARNRPEFSFKFLFFSALARHLAGDEPGARERYQRASVTYPNIDGYDYERAEAGKALAAAPPLAPASSP